MSNQEQANGEEDVPGVLRPQSGPDRDEMAAAFLPESEQHQGKTILDLHDPGRVAILRQLTTLYPELSELDPVIDEFVSDFMQSRTSVSGKSRNEIRDILMSMYGSNPDSDDGQLVLQALGAEEDE